MCVKIEWRHIVNELHDWDDIIGEDITNAILNNLEERIDDEQESAWDRYCNHLKHRYKGD